MIKTVSWFNTNSVKFLRNKYSEAKYSEALGIAQQKTLVSILAVKYQGIHLFSALFPFISFCFIGNPAYFDVEMNHDKSVDQARKYIIRVKKAESYLRTKMMVDYQNALWKLQP